MTFLPYKWFVRFWGEAPVWVRWFLASAVLAMVVFSGADALMTEWLAQRNWPAFSTFQDRSFFEEGVIGGSDLGLLLQIGSVVTLIFHLVSDRSVLRLPGWQRFNASVALSCLHIGLVVHGLKFAWARARPYVVAASDVDAYTSWYQPGRLSVIGSNVSGSFPSGHSAAAAAFFVLAFYVPRRFQGWPTLYRMCALGLAVSFWGAMLIARPMSRAHYITDCLASGVIVVFSLTLFTQIFGLDRAGSFSPLPPDQKSFYRAGLVFLVTLAFLGLVLVVRLFA